MISTPNSPGLGQSAAALRQGCCPPQAFRVLPLLFLIPPICLPSVSQALKLRGLTFIWHIVLVFFVFDCLVFGIFYFSPDYCLLFLQSVECHENLQYIRCQEIIIPAQQICIFISFLKKQNKRKTKFIKVNLLV